MVFVELFPEASVHAIVIVYTRPLPERSALRFTVRFPVITQSGAVSPSPVPLPGSLLLTEVILQTGAASQMSDAAAVTVTGAILWFGGQSTLGLAATEEITGGVVSCTITAELQELEFPALSVSQGTAAISQYSCLTPTLLLCGTGGRVCRAGKKSRVDRPFRLGYLR